jgi:hypothetical protein
MELILLYFGLHDKIKSVRQHMAHYKAQNKAYNKLDRSSLIFWKERLTLFFLQHSNCAYKLFTLLYSDAWWKASKSSDAAEDPFFLQLIFVLTFSSICRHPTKLTNMLIKKKFALFDENIKFLYHEPSSYYQKKWTKLYSLKQLLFSPTLKISPSIWLSFVCHKHTRLATVRPDPSSSDGKTLVSSSGGKTLGSTVGEHFDRWMARHLVLQ